MTREADYSHKLPAPVCLPSEQSVSRSNRPVVDADVINQAGPKRPGGHVLAAAQDEAARRIRQATLCVFGHKDIIRVKTAAGAIPGDADAMLGTLSNGRI